MEPKTAKDIGQQLAVKSALKGLFIAYVLFAWITYSWDKNLMKCICWIFYVEFWYHLLIGAFGLIAMAYFFGRLAGIEILIKGRNEFITGIKHGFIILLTGTIMGSSVGFFQEGIDDIGGFGNPFFDYYFKPLYWVFIFGLIPVILLGAWFGGNIKKHGQNIGYQNKPQQQPEKNADD